MTVVFLLRDARGPARVAITGADTDLAQHDDLQRARNAAGVTTLVTMQQVHGADVAVLGPGTGASGSPRPRSAEPVADAVVTSEPGVALVARAADCVPVLLASLGRPAVVAAVHAGRAGMAAGVIGAAVAAMRDQGADDLTAWVGPHVCGRCYEVPAALGEEVAAAVPESRSETSWGTPALDLGAGVTAQLAAAGVRDVVRWRRCTLEDDQFHSYRRSGDRAGRHGGLVWLAGGTP